MSIEEKVKLVAMMAATISAGWWSPDCKDPIVTAKLAEIAVRKARQILAESESQLQPGR